VPKNESALCVWCCYRRMTLVTVNRLLGAYRSQTLLLMQPDSPYRRLKVQFTVTVIILRKAYSILCIHIRWVRFIGTENLRNYSVPNVASTSSLLSEPTRTNAGNGNIRAFPQPQYILTTLLYFLVLSVRRLTRLTINKRTY
jgi:hypothetical protein